MAVNIITLLTDFGTIDSYVAQMKGVLLSECASCSIVDVTHEVPPQDVARGAKLLAEYVPRFPAGTVHLAVVDPGVGTDRRFLVARILGQTVVAPDNGLISDLCAVCEDTGCEEKLPMQVIHVTSSKFVNNNACTTFHGRDIFAPIVAFLVNGGHFDELGPIVYDFKLLPKQDPVRQLPDGAWSVPVEGIDHFGNIQVGSTKQLMRRLFEEDFSAERFVQIERDSGSFVRLRARIVRTYGEAKKGDLVLLQDSQGRLEMAVVLGSAAETLKVASSRSVGPIRLRITE